MDPRVQEEKEEGEGTETGSERGRQKKKGKGKRKGAWGLREPERVGVDRKFCNLRLAVDSALSISTLFALCCVYVFSFP